MAPGHESRIANFTPSSGVSPKCPFTMRIAPNPWHRPVVGKALNWHGQPQAQLQLTTSSPLIRQVVLIASAMRVFFRPVCDPIYENRETPVNKSIGFGPAGVAVRVGRVGRVGP